MVFVSELFREKQNEYGYEGLPAFIKIYTKTSLEAREAALCFKMFDVAFQDQLWALSTFNRYVYDLIFNI